MFFLLLDIILFNLVKVLFGMMIFLFLEIFFNCNFFIVKWCELVVVYINLFFCIS